MKHDAPCIICGGRTVEEFSLYDDRYGFQGCYVLVACQLCGHRSLATHFAPDEICRLYTDYYPRGMESLDDFRASTKESGLCSWLSGDMRSAFRWIPENVRILDIGCGLGESLAYHRSRGCEVYGVEADSNIRRIAERFGFNVHVGLFEPQLYEPGYFDYVTMDQVIEHMNDPLAVLRGIFTVLKSSGVLVVSTPNAQGWGARMFRSRWINWHAPYHLHHFSERSMRIAAEISGFKVELARTLTSSEWLHYQWNHMLLYPFMGEPSPFWSLKVRRTVRVKFILGMLELVRRTRINHLVTRFFDALGIGDNFLFFLRKS